ncbi:MAG: ATP-binding protein [Syntrophorhabdaceae bacterium]|nr:ATP-binding protein [Syntrophorhabdaceae bacterium]
MSKVQYSDDKGLKMMKNMNIAFASGKGGTGKTTIAVNLAYFLARSGEHVQYLDCDVEEPNGHIFLKPKIDKSAPANVLVPVIDQDKCTSCGECSSHCQFNALVTLPNNVLLFPELCHGCGLCIHICPERAIRDGDREIGLIEKGTATEDIDFIHGILNVGEPMAGPLIHEVKHHYKENYIRIIDAPPGTSCPVVKTIFDADVVVMVTEPTPFGLHDLKIAVSVAKNLGRPIGIVINRQNGEFSPLEEYLSENDLPVIMALPEDREIARHYSAGDIILKSLPAYAERFTELALNIGRLLGKTQCR